MDWSYESWPTGEPYDWGSAGRGHTIYDAEDYHVDLGCGKLKKGRIGIDRYPAPGVNIVMDLDFQAVFAVAPEPGRDAVEFEEDGSARSFRPDGEPFVYPSLGRGIQMRQVAIGFPFATNAIESIISHHALEHIGAGFLALIDEVYRVLKPGGIFYAITPLFPSHTAVSDADHKRYFMDTTWDAFCGTPGDGPNNCWLSSFSVPYTTARFEKLHQDMTPPAPPEKQWTQEDAREIRVALRAVKE